MLQPAWRLTIARAGLAGSAYLLGLLLKTFSYAEIQLYIAFGVAVVFASLVVEYWQNVRPPERWLSVAPFIMEGLTQKLFDRLRNGAKVEPRMCILVPRKRFFWPWQRDFRVIWQRGMTDHPDVNLIFPVESGVAGECYQRKTPIYADPLVLKEPQKLSGSNTSDLTTVVCYPIFEPPGASGIQSGQLIGVLCLDSKTPDAFKYLDKPVILDSVHENMRNVATLVSRMLY